MIPSSSPIPRVIATPRACTLLLVGAMSFLAPAVIAAPPPVTIAQPVQVEVINPVEVKGPVDVQGVVGIVEPSRIPYYAQIGKFVNNGEKSATADLEIPVGKRFVIESMSAFARCPENQFPSVTLFALVKNGAPATAKQGEVDIVMQYQGSFELAPGLSARFYVGSQPLKMVVDSTAHVLEAKYFKALATGDGTFWINLIGYLEDL